MSNDTKIEDYEREPVPQHLRKSWLSMAFVWIAIGIDLSAMFLGALTRRGHEHRRLAYGGHRRFSHIRHNRSSLRICGSQNGPVDGHDQPVSVWEPRGAHRLGHSRHFIAGLVRRSGRLLRFQLPDGVKRAMGLALVALGTVDHWRTSDDVHGDLGLQGD